MAITSVRLHAILVCALCLAGMADGEYACQDGSVSRESEPVIESGQEPFKIRVDAGLVTADVSVIGAAPELGAEDFIIADNNVDQEVSHFSQDQYPLAVAILIDGSLSIQPYLPVLQIAAASALRRLKPGDQGALYSFNSSVLRLSELTDDRYLIADRIGKLKVAFGTNIFGTIFEAVNYLSKKAPHRRRAIILVSDNCHAMGTNSADSCRVALLEKATTLYNIRTPGDNVGGYAGECHKSDLQIQQLAADSGGEVLDAQQPASLQAALEKAISRLRMQYTLGFNPSDPGQKGSFHKLSVRLAPKVRCPDCRVLARSGYFAGVSPSLPPPENISATQQPDYQETDQLLIRKSIMTAGTIDLDLPGIPFTVKTSEQKGVDSQAQLKVDLQISLEGIQFRSVEEGRTCRLQVAIFYADSKGKILGSEWKMIEGKMGDETYRRMQKTGIPFSAVVPLKTGKHMLKVVVYDEESDNVGSKLVKLR